MCDRIFEAVMAENKYVVDVQQAKEQAKAHAGAGQCPGRDVHHCADVQQGQTHSVAYGNSAGKSESVQEPLIVQLSRRSNALGTQRQVVNRDLSVKEKHLARAQDILRRHPEFEELMELQDLLRSGVLF